MNICVFDTETTSLEKPFCYNIGYVIADTESGKVLLRRSYVVEQVWHNEMLFTTAYYNNKRPIYIANMRARHTTLSKFGYICGQMKRDFITHNVKVALAYNSPFDDKVFTFNCDWFHCNNPFENIPIHDVRGFAHNFLCDRNFEEWCEENEEFTESGNYSSTAETLFRYISKDNEFNEEHTALADSEIEFSILMECIKRGANIETEYAVKRSLKRSTEKTLKVTDRNGDISEFPYNFIRINSAKTEIKLK